MRLTQSNSRAVRGLGLAPLAASAAVLLVIGVGFAISPASIVVLVAGGAGAIAMARWPRLAFVVFLFIQLICPLYLAVPIVPVLPAFPLSLVVLAVTAAVVVLQTDEVPRVSRHPVTLAFAAYGAALALSVLFSIAPLSTWNGLIRCFAVPFTVYWMTWRVVRSPREAILPLDMALLGAVIMSLYGMAEFAIGWNPLIENLAAPTGQDGDLLYWNQRETLANIYRSFSVEMNPLYFGTTVSMLFPYAMARFGMETTLRRKAVFALAGCLCIAGVMTTFSRGPLIAVVVAAVGLALLFPALRRLVLIAGLCGALAGLAMLPWLSSEIWERFSDPDNVEMRLKLWQVAWSMFLTHPWTGVGLDGFTFHQLDILRAYEIGPFPEHAIGELETVGTADGTLPQLAAEAGLPGLAAVAALSVVAARSLVRTMRHGGAVARLVAASAGLAACAYVINGLTITIYTAYTPTIMLGVVLALAASLDRDGLEPGTGLTTSAAG